MATAALLLVASPPAPRPRPPKVAAGASMLGDVDAGPPPVPPSCPRGLGMVAEWCLGRGNAVIWG